jgi:hypothetical protein
VGAPSGRRIQNRRVALPKLKYKRKQHFIKHKETTKHLRNVEEGAHGMHAEQRRLGFCHFDDGDAERPDVDLPAISAVFLRNE